MKINYEIEFGEDGYLTVEQINALVAQHGSQLLSTTEEHEDIFHRLVIDLDNYEGNYNDDLDKACLARVKTSIRKHESKGRTIAIDLLELVEKIIEMEE